VVNRRLTVVQVQQALVDKLTTQAAQAEPLTRSGKGSVLHLVTREAADEEKRAVERDMARWNALAKEKDETNEQNKRQITELQQSGTFIRSFLQCP
jgi:hypothetical protein